MKLVPYTRLLPLFAILLLSGLLTACESAPPNIGATLSEVTDDPEQFMGDVVTVSGEVENTWGATAFKMGDLLVIAPSDVTIKGGTAAISRETEENVAQVTGTVVSYSVADIEAEYGVDLAEDVEYTEGEPAIVATTIYLTPTPTANFTGYPTAAIDALVIQVVSDRVFFIESGPSGRLPVYLDENATPQDATEGKVDINEGQVISLAGTLLPIPDGARLQSEWGLGAGDVGQFAGYTFYFRAQRVAGVPPTAPGAGN